MSAPRDTTRAALAGAGYIFAVAALTFGAIVGLGFGLKAATAAGSIILVPIVGAYLWWGGA